jgi:hypothetical protein
MHINHHSVSSRYCGSKYFHFPYCNMDKFIIKWKRKIDEKSESDDSVEPRTLKSATASGPSRDVSANSVEPSTSKPKIPKNVYYNESDIKYRFVSIMCDPPLPLCTICNQTLSNNSMQPSLLHRHLVTNRGEYKDKAAEFFKRKAENLGKTSNLIRTQFYTIIKGGIGDIVRISIASCKK